MRQCLIALLSLTIILSTYTPNYTYASTPTRNPTEPIIEWQRTYKDNTGTYIGNSVQPTPDGGYVVVGSNSSYGIYESDIYLFKTDSAGNILLKRSYGGKGSDVGTSIQITPDGRYIITGGTDSYGSRAYNIFLLKTGSSGEKQWIKTYGGDSYKYGYSVQVTPDGGYIVTGIGSPSVTGYPAHIFLLKTDSSGNTLWFNFYPFQDSSYGYSVQVTVDGGYIVTGQATMYVSNGNYLEPYQGVALVKVDSSGKLQWQRRYEGEINEGHSVQQTPDGGYVVTGQNHSNYRNFYYIHLLKTDSMGGIEWSKNYNSTGMDCGYSVQVTPNGYIIAGSTLIGTDKSGNMLWEKPISGLSIQPTPDGFILLGNGDSVFLQKLLETGTGVHFTSSLTSINREVEQGNSITMILRANNTGSAPLTELQIEMQSPGFTFLSTDSLDVVNASRSSPIEPMIGSREGSWGKWIIQPGGSVSVTFRVKAESSLLGNVALEASVSAYDPSMSKLMRHSIFGVKIISSTGGSNTNQTKLTNPITLGIAKVQISKLPMVFVFEPSIDGDGVLNLKATLVNNGTNSVEILYGVINLTFNVKVYRDDGTEVPTVGMRGITIGYYKKLEPGENMTFVRKWTLSKPDYSFHDSQVWTQTGSDVYVTLSPGRYYLSGVLHYNSNTVESPKVEMMLSNETKSPAFGIEVTAIGVIIVLAVTIILIIIRMRFSGFGKTRVEDSN